MGTDVVLLLFNIHSMTWLIAGVIFAHLVAFGIFGYFVLPIFWLHLGFVSRNELGNEWKHDEFYIVRDDDGNPTWVGDLDPEEFNERFDSFEYDSSRNPFDRGCRQNWRRFLC